MTKTNLTDKVEKSVLETKDQISFTEKTSLKESALLEFSTSLKNDLTPEQRVAFFEKYLDKDKPTSYEFDIKTSSGTPVTLIKLGELYLLRYEGSGSKAGFYYFFQYGKDGFFDKAFVTDKQSMKSIEEYDSSNKWAVKRGDSFIRDIQKANPKQ